MIRQLKRVFFTFNRLNVRKNNYICKLIDNHHFLLGFCHILARHFRFLWKLADFQFVRIFLHEEGANSMV